MNKNEKLIMVVDRDVLFGKDYFQGFRYHKEVNYERRILKNFKYIERDLVENNPELKQPIAYMLIVNPNLKKVFVFQRASHDKAYGEKRLQGKWSWGVGGHIEKMDVKSGNPIKASMMRELKEEVEISGNVRPVMLGYINDDRNSVGKVHFGILYLIETDAEAVKPRGKEITSGSLRSLEDMEKINSEFVVEEWSKIALEPLKKILS